MRDVELKTIDDLREIAVTYKYRDVREVAKFAIGLLAARAIGMPAPPKSDPAERPDWTKGWRS